MLEKAETEGNFSKTQKIEDLLVDLDLTGQVPTSIVEQPGAFMRQFYEAWYENGGLEGGKPRNSIRRMRNEWLKGKAAVPSLHPKLTGQIKLNRSETNILVDLFLTKWKYAGNRRDVSNVSPEGYIQFPTSDKAVLSRKVVDALFADQEDSGAEGLLLPDQSIGKIVQQEQEEIENIDELYQIILQADTTINMSRQKTILGPNSEDTMRIFWHSLNSLYNYDKENKDNKRNIVWMISSGERYIEDTKSVAEFFNIGFLFMLLKMFTSFHSERDQSKDVRDSIAKKLWIPETTQRQERAQWLEDNSAVIVQNLNKEIYKKLYPEEVDFIDKLRLKDTDITPEHVFPSVIPSVWSKSMKSIYKKSLGTLDQATISVHLQEGEWADNQKSVRFAVHGAVSEYPPLDKGNFEDILWHFKSLELPSPGQSYEDAAHIVRLAVTYRLRHAGELEVTDESIALAYLQKIGYQVLTLSDFSKIFANFKEKF